MTALFLELGLYTKIMTKIMTITGLRFRTELGLMEFQNTDIIGYCDSYTFYLLALYSTVFTRWIQVDRI